MPNTSVDEESEEYDTILLRRWYVVRRAIWGYAQRHFLPMILYVSAKKDKNNCQSARRKTIQFKNV